MKYLFDENLSPFLCKRLADVLPDSIHVRDVGLQSAADSEIWEYARTQGLTIVTKDTDFNSLAFLIGFPPKIVLIQLGNASTSAIERLLRSRLHDLLRFEASDDSVLLVLA